MRNDAGLFVASQWISWLGAAIVAAVMAMSWAYSTFETKDTQAISRDANNARLDRIEAKIDFLTEQLLNRKDDKYGSRKSSDTRGGVKSPGSSGVRDSWSLSRFGSGDRAPDPKPGG